MDPSGRTSPAAASLGSDVGLLADLTLLAAALSGARHAMLVAAAPSGAAPVICVHGFDHAPREPARLLRLHLEAGGGDEPILTRLPISEADGDPWPGPEWSGWHLCGLPLLDADASVVGLLCLLRAERFARLPRPALRVLGRRLAATLEGAFEPHASVETPSTGQPSLGVLAEAMSESAWVCDIEGRVLWRNRAFAGRFAEESPRERFLTRWRESAGRGGLLSARLSDGRAVWLDTRAQTLDHNVRGLSLGFAAEVTPRIDQQLELGRLGGLRETRGAMTLVLDRVLPGMIERVRGMLGGGPDFVLEPPEGERLTVWCDPHRLESALLDIASACGSAWERVRISLALSHRASTGHAALTLEVQRRARARAEPLRDRLALLPMVHELLRESGGVLEAGWPPGSGAALLLPLHRPAAIEQRAPASARILVVDDEAVVRMLVVDLLRERGHTVQEAEDAFAAMAMVQDGAAFDLMITDIGLPGGFDGSTLARRTRLLRPDLPILFITGYAYGTNNDVTLEPGIPVLTKPFTLGALSSRIAELLSADAA